MNREMTYTPTQAQQQIYDFVKNGTGNGIIDAVAGAGKTTTLIECVEYIQDPHDVLYCAFNTSIRKEIHKKFVKKGKSVDVKTIHGLGFHILRSHDHAYELDDKKYIKILEHKEFYESIIPQVDSILTLRGFLSTAEVKSMKERRKELSLEDKNLLSESIGNIGKISDTILTINHKYRLTLCGSSMEEYRKMVDHYNILGVGYPDRELELYVSIHKKLLQEGNSIAISDKVIDYTDMLYLPSHLELESKQKYGFVFVDECQDLSKAQLAIVKKYLRTDSRVLAVGDPYQSIYGFAGADADSFESVKHAFNCQPLGLTDCFRCPKNVIDLAKTIREDISGFKQVAGVVRTIEHRFILATLKPGDLVICRHRDPLHLLTLKLINKDIKVHIHPDEVQEFIGDYKRYFKSTELSKNLAEDNIEIFFNKIKKRNIQQIKNDCKNIDAVIRDIKIDREIRLLEESLDFLTKKFNEWQINTIGSILLRLKELLAYLGDDAIKISTIHRAKGLENERVFILEYNKLPIKRILEWENIQERNLHYVAVTRAVEELYLCNEETEPDELDVIDPDLPFSIDDTEDDASEAENRTIEPCYRTIKIATITKLSNTPKKYYSFGDLAETPYPSLTRQCQRAKYWAILEALQDTEYSIDNIVCSNYMDTYIISSPNGIRTYNGYYNSAGTYKFIPKESYDDNLTILKYLNDETNYPISFEYKPLTDGFEAVHSIITAGCKELKILITNIYKEQYSLTYCLKTPRAYAYIKLSFNGQGIITTLAPYSSIGADDQELNYLLEIISHLWQR
jgi:superfamily I DNA/RNA helicase